MLSVKDGRGRAAGAGSARGAPTGAESDLTAGRGPLSSVFVREHFTSPHPAFPRNRTIAVRGIHLPVIRQLKGTRRDTWHVASNQVDREPR